MSEWKCPRCLEWWPESIQPILSEHPSRTLICPPCGLVERLRIKREALPWPGYPNRFDTRPSPRHLRRARR